MKLIHMCHEKVTDLFPNGPVYDSPYRYMDRWNVDLETVGQLTLVMEKNK